MQYRWRNFVILFLATLHQSNALHKKRETGPWSTDAFKARWAPQSAMSPQMPQAEYTPWGYQSGWRMPWSYAGAWNAPMSQKGLGTNTASQAAEDYYEAMKESFRRSWDMPYDIPSMEEILGLDDGNEPLPMMKLAPEMQDKEIVVNAEFGGNITLNFTSAVPVGTYCFASKASDGWDVPYSLAFPMLASYNTQSSISCNLPPVPEISGPFNLHLKKGGRRSDLLTDKIRLRYQTTLAVSFDQRPYYAASGGEVLVHLNVPEEKANQRLQIRVNIKGPGYVMRQLLAVDVKKDTKAAYPVSFKDLPEDMDEHVTVELWKGPSNIMGIRSFGFQPDGEGPDSTGSEVLATHSIRLIRVSTKKRGQSAVDFKHRSLIVDERPFFPIAWFSTYLSFGLQDTIQSLKDLAQRGVNSLMLYNLIAGPGPQSTHYDIRSLPLNPHVEAILDAAHAVGIKFQISLLEVVRPLGSGYSQNYALLDYSVNKWKDHPATMAWYVADDDGGFKLPEIYKRIRSMDPHHIITMAVQGVGKTKEARFMQGSDVVMIENYPQDAAGAYDNMAVISNWPTEFMPAITCGRSWAIAEDGAIVTQQLFRAQLYQSLIAGTTGEIWFAYRNAEGWNEPGVPLEEAAGEAARELLDLSLPLSSFSDYDPATFIPPTKSFGRTELEPVGTQNVSSVRSRAFREPSGCVTLLISNSVNEPVEATVQFGFGSPGIFDEQTSATEAVAVFELGEKLRRVPVRDGKIVEFMPALGVQVFRLNGSSTCASDLPSPSTTTATAPTKNYILNPSFEEFGAYVSDPLHWVCGMSPNGGEGSSCYADAQVRRNGRHAGRFVTGMSPEKFHIHPDVEFKKGVYTGSIWAQSDTPDMNLFVGRAPKPTHAYQRNLAPAQYSVMNNLTLTNQWQQLNFTVELSDNMELAFRTDKTGVLWLDDAALFRKEDGNSLGNFLSSPVRDLSSLNQYINNNFLDQIAVQEQNSFFGGHYVSH